MNIIKVVDARMGRGKTSAAIRYMNEHRGQKRFLYVTPYLNEVDRICEQCGFEQAEGCERSKSSELKVYMRSGKNVAMTHSLFQLMDEEALDLATTLNYSLIVDESLNTIERLTISKSDLDILKEITTQVEGGYVRWIDPKYEGRFSKYKYLADTNNLCIRDTALLKVTNTSILTSFSDVIMLTYLFEGQYQKAYLDYLGLEYQIVGVECDERGMFFSDKPDVPPSVDYRELINIVSDTKLNKPGDGKHALSKSWFDRKKYSDIEIKRLRNGLRTFFQRNEDGARNTRLWTTFAGSKDKIIEKKSNRFSSSFLQVSARATNEYKGRTDIAYLANRFVDPNLIKFFSSTHATVDQDMFALSEMLQWIWRSAIRDNKPINLYIPSSRMRKLLTDWIEDTYKGEQ